MKCKVIRQRRKEKKEAIRKAISALAELNPKVEFSDGNGRIYTSCKTPTDLLEIEMPEGIAKIGDPEESACYGVIYVRIGKYEVSIGAAGVY